MVFLWFTRSIKKCWISPDFPPQLPPGDPGLPPEAVRPGAIAAQGPPLRWHHSGRSRRGLGSHGKWWLKSIEATKMMILPWFDHDVTGGSSCLRSTKHWDFTKDAMMIETWVSSRFKLCLPIFFQIWCLVHFFCTNIISVLWKASMVLEGPPSRSPVGCSGGGPGGPSESHTWSSFSRKCSSEFRAELTVYDPKWCLRKKKKHPYEALT